MKIKIFYKITRQTKNPLCILHRSDQYDCMILVNKQTNQPPTAITWSGTFPVAISITETLTLTCETRIEQRPQTRPYNSFPQPASAKQDQGLLPLAVFPNTACPTRSLNAFITHKNNIYIGNQYFSFSFFFF